MGGESKQEAIEAISPRPGAHDLPHLHTQVGAEGCCALAIESLWSPVRQRTELIDVFTTEDSCLAHGAAR